MITVDALKNFGANVDEGLGRCMGNEALYLKLVATIPGEKNFGKLSESIQNNDLDGAFEAAHALKGVLGNLSLTNMYDKVADITELLRARTEMDYSEKVAEIINARDELAKLCE
jgi:HPt (histidine-containing phosphotransfer) domain-containing protein